jgi:hypothetical protein
MHLGPLYPLRHSSSIAKGARAGSGRHDGGVLCWGAPATTAADTRPPSFACRATRRAVLELLGATLERRPTAGRATRPLLSGGSITTNPFGPSFMLVSPAGQTSRDHRACRARFITRWRFARQRDRGIAACSGPSDKTADPSPTYQGMGGVLSASPARPWRRLGGQVRPGLHHPSNRAVIAERITRPSYLNSWGWAVKRRVAVPVAITGPPARPVLAAIARVLDRRPPDRAPALRPAVHARDRPPTSRERGSNSQTSSFVLAKVTVTSSKHLRFADAWRGAPDGLHTPRDPVRVPALATFGSAPLPRTTGAVVSTTGPRPSPPPPPPWRWRLIQGAPARRALCESTVSECCSLHDGDWRTAQAAAAEGRWPKPAAVDHHSHHPRTRRTSAGWPRAFAVTRTPRRRHLDSWTASQLRDGLQPDTLRPSLPVPGLPDRIERPRGLLVARAHGAGRSPRDTLSVLREQPRGAVASMPRASCDATMVAPGG